MSNISSYTLFSISSNATDYTLQVSNNAMGECLNFGIFNKLSKQQLTNFVNGFYSVNKFVKFNCGSDLAKNISAYLEDDVIVI